MGTFVEISIIIAIAVLVAMIMKLLKQPFIIGYILTGIIAGPYFLNVIHNHETIEIFSKIGITMLLFIVGLHLSPKIIKEVGRVSVIGGLGQVIITSTIGFIIALFLGLERTAAMYIGMSITFSSTIIILKLLSDKGDIHKLYGKIAIGLLLVQDIVATVVLIITTSVGATAGGNVGMLLMLTLVKGVFLISLLMISSGFVLPALTRFVARSQELLFLFSIAWGMGMATVFYLVGFSVEIGALVAGVTLASTPFSYEISSRLRPLRDFFVVLFFILLGSQMVLSNLREIALPAVLLSLFVLVGNPIIVIILMNLLGFNKRTSFMAGMTITQMSEFSLILATVGFEIGHLSRQTLSLITLVGLITIVFSTYIILHSHTIYPFMSKLLSLLELRKSKKGDQNTTPHSCVLFGYHRIGQDFVKSFQKLDMKFMVVDFNPEHIKLLSEQNIPYEYGDAEDAEFLYELHLPKLKFVVSTIPDFATNLLIVSEIRRVNKKAIIITLSRDVAESEELYAKGASYVILPDYLGAKYAAHMIAEYGLETEKYDDAREKHLKYFETRIA